MRDNTHGMVTPLQQIFRAVFFAGLLFPYVKGSAQSAPAAAEEINLPSVELWTPDGTDITKKTEWREGCRVWIADADGQVLLNDTLAKLRARGNTTLGRPKKPYAIRLSERKKVLGMLKHKRWCLLADVYDRTHLKNDVAFWLGQHSGLGWTPHGQHVWLRLNGREVGLYYLCEQIRIDKHRVDIDEMTPDDVAGEALTGGYLLGLSIDDEADFRTAVRDLPVTLKSTADSVADEQWAYIRQYVDSVEHLLYAADGPDPAVEEMLDMDSFAAFWLLSELTCNQELRHPKSLYWYKPRGGRLMAGPLWDFDWAFRTYKGQGTIGVGYLYYPVLLTMPAFRAAVVRQWHIIRSEVDGVMDYIDQQAERLRPYALRDREMWPEFVTNSNYDKEFDDAVAEIKSCIALRINVLDAYVAPMGIADGIVRDKSATQAFDLQGRPIDSRRQRRGLYVSDGRISFVK